MSEALHQQALFQWARNPAIVKTYPAIDLLEGTLNGVKLTIGQAGKAKAAGMLKGVHDVRLPVARGGYFGLSIEMKFGRNKMTDEQIWYANRLGEEGWSTHVAYDWTTARDTIIWYLELPATTRDANIFARSGSIIETS
jgi:hypothetical protein